MHIDEIVGAHDVPHNGQAAGVRTDAQFEYLLEYLRPMLLGMARNFSMGDRAIQDDYFQVGSVGVWQAFRSHDAARGELEHFAMHCARRQMLNQRRRYCTYDVEISIGDMMFQDCEEWVVGEAYEAHKRLCREAVTESLSVSKDCSFIWDIAAEKLTSRELAVIRLVYFDGMLHAEAARELRISPPRITQLVASALAKLREAITKRFSLN